MPAAVAIPAAVSAGSSIFSGILGSHAANKAAQMQAQAAERESQRFQQTLDQYNPKIQSAADQARSDVLASAARAGGNLTDIAKAAGVNLTDVAERGATGVTGAADKANEYLSPYMQLGEQGAKSLGEMMQPGGALNRDFTFADMQALDPGYQFRIDQANKALAGSAAARGGALGGGAVRSALNLSQNLASSEYGAAFDRFRAQGQDRFNRFSNIMDLGARTGTQAGANLMTAADRAAALRADAARTAGGWNVGAGQTVGGWDIDANKYGGNAEMDAANTMANNAFKTTQSISDLMTGAANARAAGTVGSANAWGSALGGVANAGQQVGNYYNQQAMLKKYGVPWGGGYGNPALRGTDYNYNPWGG